MSEEYLKKNIDKVKDYGSVIERRLDDEVDLERLVNCSKEFKNEALEHDIPVIEISERYDIDEIMDRALTIIG